MSVIEAITKYGSPVFVEKIKASHDQFATAKEIVMAEEKRITEKAMALKNKIK